MKAFLLLLLIITLGLSVWLVTIEPTAGAFRLRALPKKTSPPARLALSVPSQIIRPNEPARMTVTLTNVWRDAFYVTTNMDTFVSGTGLLRNYYFTITGACKPRQITRATLNFGFGTFGERELLNAGAIVLLKPGQSHRGDLPLETWGSLVSAAGRCWIQAHYRGEIPSGEFSRPFISQSLHSNYVEIDVR
jgi:hypothetical protein